MRFKIAARTLVIFGVTLVLSMAGTAQSVNPTCSLARAAGTYGFTTSGTVIGVGPRVSAGMITLDAAGNVTNGKATSSLNGAITQEEFTGTYTVNSDCTGSATIAIRDLSGNLLLTVTLDSVWDDGMKQARYVFTSATLPDGTSLLTVISADTRKMVP